MALSDDKLWHLWNAQGTDDMSREEAFVFARAIEAEVRKDDEALIEQMDVALDAAEAFLLSAGFDSSDAFQEVTAALTAARARLEKAP